MSDPIERISVTQRLRGVIDDPECQRLLSSIEIVESPLERPLMSEKQLNSLREWPSNWVGSTVEMAVRLELCRPAANAGHPFPLDFMLRFLTQLPEGFELYDGLRLNLTEAFKDPWARSLSKKASTFFEEDDMFISVETMRNIARAAALEQYFRGNLDDDQLDWADSLTQFHASLLNAAVWLTLRLLNERAMPVIYTHYEFSANHSRRVCTGEFDFATPLHLIDLKCSSKRSFELSWRLQLLMYWRMGLQTGSVEDNPHKRRFEQFSELGVINPFCGNYLAMRVRDIPRDVVEYIDNVVLDFSRPVVIGERAFYAETDIGEEMVISGGVHPPLEPEPRPPLHSPPAPPPPQPWPKRFAVQQGAFEWSFLAVEDSSGIDAFQPHEIVFRWFTFGSPEDAAKAIALVASVRDELQMTDPATVVPATGAVRMTALPKLAGLFERALSYDASELGADGACSAEAAHAAELAARAQRFYVERVERASGAAHA